MAAVKVSKTARISSAQLTLKDLRELVKACEGMAEDAKVSPKHDSGGYGGSSYDTITVTE